MPTMIAQFAGALDDRDSLLVWDIDVTESADDPEDYAWSGQSANPAVGRETAAWCACQSACACRRGMELF
ncbi:MAG: hypothetical protein ACYCVB_05245 [Bacilli bacterium]